MALRVCPIRRNTDCGIPQSSSGLTNATLFLLPYFCKVLLFGNSLDLKRYRAFVYTAIEIKLLLLLLLLLLDYIRNSS